MKTGRYLHRAAVAAAAGAVGLLFAPWGRSGEVGRSSIQLLRSATVLDVLSDMERIALLLLWLAVIVAVAGALVASSWGRPRLVAGLLIPLGPALVFAALVVTRSPLRVQWGAGASATLGLTASALGGLILIGSASGGGRS